MPPLPLLFSWNISVEANNGSLHCWNSTRWEDFHWGDLHKFLFNLSISRGLGCRADLVEVHNEEAHRTFTEAEVLTHNKRTDLWIILKNKVCYLIQLLIIFLPLILMKPCRFFSRAAWTVLRWKLGSWIPFSGAQYNSAEPSLLCWALNSLRSRVGPYDA